MGRRGPKPRPNVLRVLHGMPLSSRTPLPAVSDPPKMSADLSEREQAAWRRVVSEMQMVPGLACRADRGVVALVARLEVLFDGAARVVSEEGATVVTLDAGRTVVKQRAEAIFVLKAAGLLRGLYGELGLTPSGRSRVSLTSAPPASKLDAFLKKRHGA